MEYQKVGRGGAGNLYSQQDLDKARNSGGDVEAQRNVQNPTPNDIASSRPEYAHSGRGGAGNYTNATELAKATAATTSVNPSLQESKPPEQGHYGRGGAGNYRMEDTERRASDVQEEERVHQQVVKDVESALKEPEKAHLGGTKLEYDTLK